MTIGAWLASRTPEPPPALRRRIGELLGDHLHDDAAQLPARCVDAAEAMVKSLLDSGRTGRECALDLLAADALVTYAFEAAADAPAQLRARATDALARLTALA